MEEEIPHQRPEKFLTMAVSELKTQQAIACPLVIMNLTWFAKITITTVFLGRLGELELAGGSLGFMFSNVTGFSVLVGLCGAMEPICGQAYGAKNFKLLHKTLVMMVCLLLLASLGSCFLWLNVDKILIYFGQQEDISLEAKKYLFYLLPNLMITSFLCPLKSYLSSQCITVPIMFTSVLGVILHVPVNVFLSRTRGFEGVAMAIWITDLVVVILLVVYVVVMECRKSGTWKEGGWCEQGIEDWVRLLKLCGPCCLMTCLEWWCYEIVILLAGKLPNAKQAVSIMAIVLNFDYLLYAVMLSLGTCASIRVSNELGANRVGPAYRSAYISLSLGSVAGLVGGLVMVLARGKWGSVFSHNKETVKGVSSAMLWMGLLELVNFPLVVCGGIVRGTARPWLGTYASIGGFYIIALPLGVFLAFKVHLGVNGLLIGFLAGVSTCVMLLLGFISRINWSEEARNAQRLAAHPVKEDCIVKT
ncbi:Multi antimicrobial extrusion protein [Artemisia annua]|uniref:Protein DETOXIFICATION n=1 Tax=Artemisia annua TaxID=35608 RepID=A0A2U1Q6B3_ARTAN|nr:Multi antimicrobial extrusion protein [Artemisia annua]